MSNQGKVHHFWWPLVLCLTAVDYFSTLGYQPSIAYESMGRIAPMGTALIVALTFLGCLTLYWRVAGIALNGEGSIGVINHLHKGGWVAKTFNIVLMGFVMTAFILTITLSSADCAEHIVEFAYWPKATLEASGVDKHVQLQGLTHLMIWLLGAVFFAGFREALGVAVVIVTWYTVNNVIVIGLCLSQVASNPEIISSWWHNVTSGQWGLSPEAMQKMPFPTDGSFKSIILNSLAKFHELALGVSGFETGVVVMTLIAGTITLRKRLALQKEGVPGEAMERVAGTRKLLLTAAVIMSLLLLGGAFSVALLIPPEAFVQVEKANEQSTTDHGSQEERPTAKNRALSYIANGQTPRSVSKLFGKGFGANYDLSTIAILFFAGASAMMGLLTLMPQNLVKSGMAPAWAGATKPLVVLITLVSNFVTWLFDASVTLQGEAYGLGVIAFMCSGACALPIYLYRKTKEKTLWDWLIISWFTCVACVFVYLTIRIAMGKPGEPKLGLMISGGFIIATLFLSVLSRHWRNKELRLHPEKFRFADSESANLWKQLLNTKDEIHLIPHRPGKREGKEKVSEVIERHRLFSMELMVLLEVKVSDASLFEHHPMITIAKAKGSCLVISATECASIPHAIAAIAFELPKVTVHFGFSDRSLIADALDFAVYGGGNVAYATRAIIVKANKEKAPIVMIS